MQSRARTGKTGQDRTRDKTDGQWLAARETGTAGFMLQVGGFRAAVTDQVQYCRHVAITGSVLSRGGVDVGCNSAISEYSTGGFSDHLIAYTSNALLYCICDGDEATRMAYAGNGYID